MTTVNSVHKGLLLIFLFSLMGAYAFAGKKIVKLGVSEPDAKIFIDGKLAGTGQVEVVVLSNATVTVRIEKEGFLTERLKFVNQKDFTPIPKVYYVELKNDDAYDASFASSQINTDIEIKTDKPEAEAWKMLSLIITSYFDIVEVTDKESGYLCTAWVVQNFSRNTVRTRMIVKLGNSQPLSYKIKLISEQSGQARTIAKSDELFKTWDRLLNKYKEVFNEIQSRIPN
jgi:hypothetical protein